MSLVATAVYLFSIINLLHIYLMPPQKLNIFLQVVTCPMLISTEIDFLIPQNITQYDITICIVAKIVLADCIGGVKTFKRS